MTLEQIFYRFCKDENVYDDIVKAINNECEAFNSYYAKMRRDMVTPKKVLNEKIKNFGYRDIIGPLMGFTWSTSAFYRRYPKFKSTCRKWRYLVDRNIVLDENTLKEGDKVSCSFFGKDIEFKVSILSPFKVINLDPNTEAFNHTFSILNIKKINDRPAQVSWLVKKNKKIYGATQRN